MKLIENWPTSIKINWNPSLLSPPGRLFVEVRDSPHGIFGSWAWYSQGSAKYTEFLGNRRRRRRRRRRLLEIQVDIQARKLL